MTSQLFICAQRSNIGLVHCRIVLSMLLLHNTVHFRRFKLRWSASDRTSPILYDALYGRYSALSVGRKRPKIAASLWDFVTPPKEDSEPRP